MTLAEQIKAVKAAVQGVIDNSNWKMESTIVKGYVLSRLYTALGDLQDRGLLDDYEASLTSTVSSNGLLTSLNIFTVIKFASNVNHTENLHWKLTFDQEDPTDAYNRAMKVVG